MVIIEPAGAHAGTDVQHAGPGGHVCEGSVSVVVVKIVAAKIIDDVEVLPSVAVIVAPVAVKTEVIVALVHSRRRGDVAERSIAFVVKQKIGRAVLGVVVGRGIAILAEPFVVAVEAQIEVQSSIAIVVAESGAGKCSFGRLLEAESVGLQLKRAVT